MHFNLTSDKRGNLRVVSAPIGNKMKIARAVKNLSQAELAERLHVSRQTITHIETGRYNPSLGLALLIAQALECPIQELFWLTTERGTRAWRDSPRTGQPPEAVGSAQAAPSATGSTPR